MIKQTKFDGYFADENGIIYSNLSGILKPLKPWYDSKRRYLYVAIKGTKYSVHRLVAQAFLPNDNNLPEINHKNMKCDDNRLDNLEWISRKDNLKHCYENGGTPIRNFRRCIVYKNNVKLISCKSIMEASKYLNKYYNVPLSMINKHLVWKEFSIIKCND